MHVQLRGPFRVRDEAGADRTPRGAKERALVALLLLSPGQRRTRAWLQDKLWSDRGPEQAAASLRQALAHVRRALGPLSNRLGSDREALWLSPEVPLDWGGAGEPLSDLDVRDPEWEDWLRDLRQGVDEAGQEAGPKAAWGRVARGGADLPALAPAGTSLFAPAGATPSAPARPVIVVCARRSEGNGGGRAVARVLSGRVTAVLLAAGDVDVVEEEAGPADPLPGPFDAAVEIETWSEPGGDPAAATGGERTAYALLRAVGPPRNRSVWMGRTKVALGLGDAWEGAEAFTLANRAAQAVIDLTALSARASPFAAVSRAVRRIHDFDPAGLRMADALLRGAAVGDAAPLALAWRGYARLTQALEFREGGAAIREEAAALAADAVARAPAHPTVLALAAKVHMTLGGDEGLGHHLAARAVAEDDANPYALDALSQALLWTGDADGGYRLALGGRRAADGLAHGFSWDMQACLAALGLGRLDEAYAHALASHRKMPAYRPALRYLVALALLGGRRAEAEHYVRRLQALEPDFRPALLVDPAYPLWTLHRLGLTEALRPLLVR